jgi:hypothetical protein
MRKLTGIVVALILGCVMTMMTPTTADAQAADPDTLISPYGMGVYAGGGVGSFTNEEMRDLTGTAGVWEARVQFGTRVPIGFEAAYQGSLQQIDALGLDTDARLVSNGLEGNVRVNFVDAPIAPYAFAGLGWRRFDLTNVNTNTSSVEDTDDVLQIPMGVGLSYRFDRLIADLRGTFRATAYEDLVPATTTSGDDFEDLSSWDVALHVGFEF